MALQQIETMQSAQNLMNEFGDNAGPGQNTGQEQPNDFLTIQLTKFTSSSDTQQQADNVKSVIENLEETVKQIHDDIDTMLGHLRRVEIERS